MKTKLRQQKISTMNSLLQHNKKEHEILQLPHRYFIFVDEVGDPFVHFSPTVYDSPSIFPVMTVTAVIVARAVYQDILMPGIDEIKEYFFSKKSIYFHSREIRRKDGIFKVFLDEKIYSDFKIQMNALFERSSLTIISSSINKIHLARKAVEFKKRTGSKYNIGDIYLRNVDCVLERLGHFLKDKGGKIIFEDRGKKESKRIQGVLTDAKNYGTYYCVKDRFQGVDDNILFFTKNDNVNGLQVADYCAYPFARHAKDPHDAENKFFDVLRTYVYQGNYNEYGLKEWP